MSSVQAANGVKESGTIKSSLVPRKPGLKGFEFMVTRLTCEEAGWQECGGREAVMLPGAKDMLTSCPAQQARLRRTAEHLEQLRN